MSQIIVNTRKYELTDTEFILFTNMTKYQFLNFVRRMTVKDCMDWRRALQVAQTNYRKTHPSTDPRIWKCVEMWMKMERMARLAFMHYKMKELWRFYPNQTMKWIKRQAKNQWEKFCSINSY